MRGVVAKRLRKEAGYHPADARKYVTQEPMRRVGLNIQGKPYEYTVVRPFRLKDMSPRVFYKFLKRKHNAN